MIIVKHCTHSNNSESSLFPVNHFFFAVAKCNVQIMIKYLTDACENEISVPFHLVVSSAGRKSSYIKKILKLTGLTFSMLNFPYLFIRLIPIVGMSKACLFLRLCLLIR